MMPDRGGTQGTFLTPYQVQIASGQLKVSGSATASGWFGALAPLPQSVPDDVRGRLFDFPAGANLDARPKANEGYSFDTLRALADSYDLLRLVIETRKDQVARMKWAIKARDGDGKADDPRITAITKFLRKPDGRTRFAPWLRALLEDLFVIDAPSIYRRRDNAGRLLALELLDGATLVRLIDDLGRTPMPLAGASRIDYPPAFQQILKGGRLDYTEQDLIYAPQNTRNHRRYGFSRVEQVITTINIGLRRQATTLDYFSEGTVPDALIAVPKEWSPDQIRQFQGLWDQLFEGDNSRMKRRAKFIPGGLSVTQTREPVLKDELDEWLARVVCFAFSVSPQALSKMMNRATAGTAKDSAEEEGLAPTLDWIKGLFDDILEDDFGAPDLEFAWQQDTAVDEAAQATILTELVSKGLMTVNEARHIRGMDPSSNPAADKLMVETATGFVLLEANTIEGKQAMQDAFPPPPPPPPPVMLGHNGGPPLDGVAEPAPAPPQASAARETRPRAVAKAVGDDDDDDPEPFGTADQEKNLLDALTAALAAQGNDTADQVEAALATVPDDHTKEHVAEAVAAALLLLSWGRVRPLTFVLSLSAALQGAAAIGAKTGAAEIGLDAAAAASAVATAESEADRRAAEMVGMRWTGPAGHRTVEPDPAAQRSIVETMKKQVAKAVGKVEAGEDFAARAAEAVRNLSLWKEAHAEGIAANEVEGAANAGAMTAYRAGGVGWGKRWAILAEACPVCVRNGAEGVVPMAHVFKSGDSAPPAHSGCRCRIVCEPVENGS